LATIGITKRVLKGLATERKAMPYCLNCLYSKGYLLQKTTAKKIGKAIQAAYSLKTACIVSSLKGLKLICWNTIWKNLEKCSGLK